MSQGSAALPGPVCPGALMSFVFPLHCHSTTPSFQESPRPFAIGSCSGLLEAHASQGKPLCQLSVHSGLASKLCFLFLCGKGLVYALRALVSNLFLTAHPLFPCLVGKQEEEGCTGPYPFSVSQELRAMARETHVATPLNPWKVTLRWQEVCKLLSSNLQSLLTVVRFI